MKDVESYHRTAEAMADAVSDWTPPLSTSAVGAQASQPASGLDAEQPPTRREALAWFREEWQRLADLAAAHTQRGDYAEAARVAHVLLPYLLATHSWDATVAVTTAGAEAAHRVNDLNRLTTLLQARGIALQQLGTDDLAQASFEEVLAVALSDDQQVARARAMAHLAQLARRRHDPTKAAELLQQAMLVYKTAGDVVGEARTLGDLANVLEDMGAPDEAFTAQQQAQQLFSAAGDRFGEAMSWRSLAESHLVAGHWDEGEGALREAIDRFEDLAKDAEAVEAKFALARMHRMQGDMGPARSTAAAALEQARLSGHGSLADDVDTFVRLLEVESALHLLAAADTDADREAVMAERPVLNGADALDLLGHLLRRARSSNDPVSAGALASAAEYLQRRREGVFEQRFQQTWEGLRSLAGANAGRLPPSLPNLLRQKLASNDPAEQSILLETALGGVSARQHPLVWARLQRELAESHFDQTSGDLEHVEDTIQHAEKALSVLTRQNAPDEWAATNMLAGSAYRIRQLGQPEQNVESALGHFRHALTVYRRRSHPDRWGAVMENLANAYWIRRSVDRDRDMARAVARHQAALSAFTKQSDRARWAQIQNNLGLVYADQAFARDPYKVELARSCFIRALGVPELAAPVRAGALANLGQCYSRRMLGDPAENIDASVRYAWQAYTAFEALGMTFYMASSASDLAGALGHRAVWTGPDDVEEAIDWYQRALELVEQEDAPLFWAGLVDNLAGTYARRPYGRPEENLRRAMELHETALAVYERHAEPFEQARAYYNFALTLSESEESDERLTRAIELYERSLQIRRPETVPLEWAESCIELAWAYLRRDQTGDLDRQTAMELLQEVVRVVAPESAPQHARRAFGLLGLTHARSGHWPAAAEAYLQGVEAVDRLYAVSLLRMGKESELAQAGDLPRLAAYALALAGNAERAVEVLERSRARLLGDRLARDRADLSHIGATHPEAASAFTAAAARVRALEQSSADASSNEPSIEGSAQRKLRALMTEAQAQLTAAVDAIRRLGYRDFLQEPTARFVGDAVVGGVSMAYLLTTEFGSMALLVRRRDAHGGINVEPIQAMLTEAKLLSTLADEPRDPTDRDGWLSELAELLGDALVGPLARRLSALHVRQVTLVPTGLLGALPLHAANIRAEGREMHLLDAFEVVYSPSARVLVAARNAAGPPTQLALVGVGNPLPSDRPLPYAEAELLDIAELFPDAQQRTLYGEQATRAELLSALPGTTYVHLACHGYYNPEQPVASLLALGQGDVLTLGDILDQQTFSGVRLVVASACESAVTDVQRLPDEAIGMPAGFLQAGAAGVIGSLWSVNDISTALLMTRFYRYHLLGDPDAGEPPMQPSRALSRAQRWLRDVTAGELAQLFDRELGAVLGRVRGLPGSADRTPADLAAEQSVRFHLEDPASRPFAKRPAHWAPFVMVGA